MLFVLSDDFITKLNTIRIDYQNRANITLDETKQPYRISRFFGAKDIKARNKQINLIEKWLDALATDLAVDKITESDIQRLIKEELSENEPGDEIKQNLTDLQSLKERIEKYHTALCVLVTVCLSIKSQIDETYPVRSGENAVLEQLMHEAMGITSTNYLDEETKACCLLATKRYLLERGRFEVVNAQLSQKFTEKQWDDFLHFVTKSCDALHGKDKTNFPITKVMMPLMGKPLELTGYTMGFLLGEMLGKSSKLLPVHYKLTAVLGSGLVMCMGPSAGLGASLLVPTYAGRILNTYCGVNLALVLGTAGNIAGQGLGLVAGFSADMGWKLIYKTGMLLAQLYSGHSNPENLNGILLVNGHRVINGVELKFVDMNTLSSQLPSNYQLCPVDFEIQEKTLKVTVNGEQTAIVPLDEEKKPIYLEELKKLFATQVEKERKLMQINGDDSLAVLASYTGEKESVVEDCDKSSASTITI
ncbi:hypothetical protein [Legionella jamestowniensis]|uniref:Substrate of the Dot/Icm secretion system n=1 Tax=Legionella jamestowniensis TaxID=455 RepID=A0A0W0UTM2_9GAMM|nr:hypothetical protein [Legionella jamestowniensis]KTD11217.1 substrate of the Dot/Icm secretion system [Legionella jamestowniensis]SFL70435.1 hypothetical protein SAMN02746073_1504 [Legionella jamestowniensis DSM 19215]